MPENKEKSRTLEEHGVFPLFREIEEESVEDAVRFILEANLNNSHDELTLIINSPGGSCSDGFALIDVMAGSKLPVKTVGVGILASMGLTIFIAGKKGSRTLTPNTAIMCHQWFGGMEGKEHELLAAVKHHKMLRDRIIRHYKKHTGLTEADIKNYLFPPNDVWLDAKEAKKLGLCDIIKEI
jgi:ATP-dependent Clp protease protease subunit